MLSKELCVTHVYTPSSCSVTLKRRRVPEVFVWLPPPYSPWEWNSIRLLLSNNLNHTVGRWREISGLCCPRQKLFSESLNIYLKCVCCWWDHFTCCDHLNFFPSFDWFPVFQPGDACRGGTFPGHALEENPIPLSDCLVLRTEENILQTWNAQTKLKWKNCILDR